MPAPNVPKTFSVFDVQTDIPGKLLPVAVFDQPLGDAQPLVELAEFLYRKLEQGMSLPKLRAIAITVGLLHDFWVLHEKSAPTTADGLPSLILKFFVARCGGTIGSNNQDSSGLYWRPIKYSTYKNDRRNLRLYSEFCVKTYGYLPLTPTVAVDELSGSSRSYKELRSEFRRSKNDFFVHLRDWRERKAVFSPSIGGRPPPQRSGSSEHKAYIPFDKLKELILRTKSVTQRLVFVAGGFAGPRTSEQLNMWREDVLPGRYRPLLFPDDCASDTPLVILAHPYDGQYLGRMSVSGQTRAQHLEEQYHRVPRPQMHKADRAGWKGMLMDNEQLQISQMYWLSEAWAQYYYSLVEELKERVLPQVPSRILNSHPYLLINDDPRAESFGMPMKRSNIRKAWERACRRIGEEPYRGPYHLHGLRDTYTRNLRLCPEITPYDRQRYLHHVSIESQTSYGKDPALLHAHMKLLEAQQTYLVGAS